MTMYFWLLIVHLLADFFLQINLFMKYLLKGRSMHDLKRENPIYIVLHVIIYIIPISLILVFLNKFKLSGAAIVFITHFLIDYIKCYLIPNREQPKVKFIIAVIDQVLHIGILFAVVNI